MTRKAKIALTPTQEGLSLLRDIRAALFAIMLCCAAITGSTCDVVTGAEVILEIIEEPDETEADRAVAGGAGIEV